MEHFYILKQGTTCLIPGFNICFYYASTVWSPHTATDIQKIESVQRRAARWAARDYRYTSSVTSVLNNLNWCPLDQRHIDCRLVMYMVTYDLVAIPASDYLTPNRRQSRHIKSLAPTLKNYYKYIFFLEQSYSGMPSQPSYACLLHTFAQFSNAVCQVVHLSP